MLSLLLALETGDYFDEENELKENLRSEYHKARKWSLDP